MKILVVCLNSSKHKGNPDTGSQIESNHNVTRRTALCFTVQSAQLDNSSDASPLPYVNDSTFKLFVMDSYSLSSRSYKEPCLIAPHGVHFTEKILQILYRNVVDPLSSDSSQCQHSAIHIPTLKYFCCASSGLHSSRDCQSCQEQRSTIIIDTSSRHGLGLL
ncbi:unnamed protein product [Somion occarium]|uniref:Protein-serine/threonine phosphatase n=1 Tax=Somion occarium TaxID=3059160 RepID=A0ABP1DZT8_9APHY